MEMVPLVSINYHLTVSREENKDALMVIRRWGDEMAMGGENRSSLDNSDFSVKVNFYQHVRFKSHGLNSNQTVNSRFRTSSSHCSPMANCNGSLRCVAKSGSKQIAQITDSVANRCIDGLCECRAFNLLHLGDH